MLRRKFWSHMPHQWLAFNWTLLDSSSRAMCAELAHQHAMEDLHNATEHVIENDAAKSMYSASSLLLMVLVSPALMKLTAKLDRRSRFSQVLRPRHAM